MLSRFKTSIELLSMLEIFFYDNISDSNRSHKGRFNLVHVFSPWGVGIVALAVVMQNINPEGYVGMSNCLSYGSQKTEKIMKTIKARYSVKGLCTH